ncbi:DUF5677 domain-containing protein [uncultured Methanolobus sp.]|uniref:DUF5677 domain-containing protein n=1 Tax=uncultured Methanolobus sp. TaxID=218300 RepID=UPI002AAB3EE1|nr:DUF5677 domain-containing protein [uncultured Methanolobus sp.]
MLRKGWRFGKDVKMFTTDENKKFIEEIYKNIDVDNFNLDDIGDVDEYISEIFNEAISEASMSTFEDLKSNLLNQLEFWRAADDTFEQRLYEVWEKPLNLLEMLIIIAIEGGSIYNEEMRPDAVQNKDYVFESLCRLHARACLVSREILNLMKGGYASGALSRWRTLHEIAVVGYFIKKHGNDVAERYLCYHVIDSYKAMRQQLEFTEYLEISQYSEKEIKYITEARDDLIDRFGKQYGEPNGWATDVFNGKRVRFADIEKEAGIDHLRPYYKLGSHSIHAESKGFLFDIGLVGTKKDIMMAGPSNMGLADPGSLMALSLSQITTCFLLMNTTVNGLIYLKTIQLLVKEIDAELSKVHEYTISRANEFSKKG